MARHVKRARELITVQLTQLVSAFLAQAGAEEPERKAPVLAELLAAAGRTSVRVMLESRGDWTPEELGSLVARVVTRGPQAA